MNFTCAFSKAKAHFLDLTLEGNLEDGKIVVSIFRKSEAGNTILNAQSSHPKHTLEAIPVGEYFMIKRACSNTVMMESQMKSLNQRLYQRGYKKWHTDKARHKVNNKTRESLLFDRSNSQPASNSNSPPTFSMAFSVDFPTIKNIFYTFYPY